MKSTSLHQDVGEFVSIVSANKNTWSHSRRKRRAEKFKQKIENTDSLSAETCCDIQSEATVPFKKLKLDIAISAGGSGDVGKGPQANADQSKEAEKSSLSADELSSSDEKPLITFTLELKLEGIHINLYLKLMDGEQKEMLHQILQYFKNRLK